ncbi:ATP-dependent Clp protease adapter protein ClpS [Paenibacillus sp. DS2015]|uniref:hypothetical protein n=1 Tax=Paenibacillus sp. DS2015 TaxID=3373917 RepID=UPI003D226B0A
MLHKIKLKKRYQAVISLFTSVIIICSISGYAYADSPDTSNVINSSKTELTKSSASHIDSHNDDVTTLKVKHAVFEGLADSHTMEITLSGEAIAIQFDEKLKLEIEQLQEGDHLKVKYTEQAVQGDSALIRNLTFIKSSCN